jgi:cyclophilin family peptidyl-prolyl cis-trans isomerase
MEISRFARLGVVWLFVGLAVAAWSAEPPAGEKPASKKADFDKVYGQWKVILSELRDLRTEYRKASAEKRPAIEQRYSELIQKGSDLQPQVTAAAEALFREDPKGAKEAGDYLLGVLFLRCQSDDFEAALPLAKLLLDGQYEGPLVHGWAGIAAFCTGEFDTAEKELKLAQDNQVFEKMGGEFEKLGPLLLADIPFYKQAWQKEQQLRAAEAKADDLPRVLLKTSKGDIEVELLENEAPNAVANFISLVEKGFYNGTPFHRVLPMFMAQGGDPTGTGKGGPGYTIPCECHKPDFRVHFRGSLSMAHAGRDTGGSQFFLTFRPTRHLDGQHTVFGRVIKGTEVLAKIQRRDPDDPEGPAPDKIVEAKVIRKRPHPYEPKKTAKSP